MAIAVANPDTACVHCGTPTRERFEVLPDYKEFPACHYACAVLYYIDEELKRGFGRRT